MEWHSKVLNSLYIFRFDNFTGLVSNSYLLSVKVSDHEINTSQSFKKGNLFFIKKISSLSFENLMRLFLDLENNIARLHIWVFISFTVEKIAFSIWSTTIYNSLDDFSVLNSFLSIALFAPVLLIDSFSFATTIITRPTSLRVHARPNHSHSRLHSTPSAPFARLHSALFAALSIAFQANPLPAHSHLLSLALIQILESTLDRVHHRLALLRSALPAAAAAHAEHRAEDVLHAAAVAVLAGAFFEAFFAVAVVGFALVFVHQDFISYRQIFELFWIPTFVGVLFNRLFPERFFDFVRSRFGIDAHDFVVAFVVDILWWAASATHAAHAGHAAHLFEVSEWETTTAAAALEEHFLSVINSNIYNQKTSPLFKVLQTILDWKVLD